MYCKSLFPCVAGSWQSQADLTSCMPSLMSSLKLHSRAGEGALEVSLFTHHS